MIATAFRTVVCQLRFRLPDSINLSIPMRARARPTQTNKSLCIVVSDLISTMTIRSANHAPQDNICYSNALLCLQQWKVWLAEELPMIYYSKAMLFLKERVLGLFLFRLREYWYCVSSLRTISRDCNEDDQHLFHVESRLTFIH